MSQRKFLVLLAVAIVAGLCWRYASTGLSRYSVDELISRGRTLQQQNEHDEAIRVYSVALEKDPLNATALYGRAFSLTQKMDAERALQDLEGAIRVTHGKHRKALLLKSFILCIVDEYDLALAEANRAIELDSTQADGYVVRAFIYTTPGKGDAGRSRLDHEKAIALAPRFKDVPPLKMISP